MGMIMRNSVILIDQIEQDRARGVPAWDAIVEAAVRRFRPIVLTAAAAVLAMIPLSRSVFWGPMAVAIMGGLIVATALTLLVAAGDVRGLVPGRTRPEPLELARLDRIALQGPRSGPAVLPSSRGWRNW